MSKKVDGFTILSSSYNNVYNFLDISIPRNQLDRWMSVNEDILDRTHFSFTRFVSNKDSVRIWVYEEANDLSENEKEQNEDLLKRHRLMDKLNLTANDVFDKLSFELHKFGIGGCSGGLLLDKEAIIFNFYTNRKIALEMYKAAKEYYPTHFVGIDTKQKGEYEIIISLNKEFEGCKFKTGPIKKEKKTINKKLELTIEEIAKKFNVDVKNLIIK